MIRALAVTLILLILFGCNKPKVINPYLTEEEKISNEIEDCLKYSWKCKIYKVVEISRDRHSFYLIEIT